MSRQLETAEQCRATCRIIDARDFAACVQMDADAARAPGLNALVPQIPEETGRAPLEIAGTSSACENGRLHELCCEPLRLRSRGRPGTSPGARVRPAHTQWGRR